MYLIRFNLAFARNRLYPPTVQLNSISFEITAISTGIVAMSERVVEAFSPATRPEARVLPVALAVQAVACCRDGDGGQLTAQSKDNDGRRGDRLGEQRRRCGLCSLVARAFRRAVCGTASRRSSDDSYRILTGPPPDDEAAVREITIDVTGSNVKYKRGKNFPNFIT
ncbi:unnamed protein product [Phyllotreta striolata]|uniref:Uncharacterized protein n=1 Tax=Phyllotreta striolata TaxID=444603 RepID=A0A9N9TH87_PHYSR|nr:unnamed protein product [Phyllotreta striolata]